MVAIQYNANDGILYHFYQHARFGLSHDIPRHGNEKNWVEMAGDIGLWTVENFPGKVWSLMKEPRWITLALTNISLVGVTYLFYPKISMQAVKAVAVQIPLPSREEVKFAAYITIVAHIVSCAFRAYGRFRNDDLMEAWYTGGAKAIPHSPVAQAQNVVLDDKE